MTEVPVTAQSSNTNTTIGNVNNFSASVTPITSPDGREGYNNYEKMNISIQRQQLQVPIIMEEN